jgi:ParB family chromosome partitioning protein
MSLSQRSKATGTPKRKKRALGRGLDALIPSGGPVEDEKEADANAFMECDVDLIQPNRYQPRSHFAVEELTQLSESIRKQGVLQPILVRKLDRGYELVAGERRLRAAKMAGLNKVPVMVKEVTKAQMLEIAIVENIQRENLNPIEEAEAYQRLITEFGLTQEQASERVGKSRSAVANFLRLLQLPDGIKVSITKGQLSMGHARALLGAPNRSQQETAWRVIIRKSLSVRQTEDLIKRLCTAKETVARKKSTTEDRHLASVADNLSRQFGTKVQIKRRGKKGKLEIEFYGNDDLNRLLALFNATA